MAASRESIEASARRLVGTWLRGRYRVDALLGWGGAAAVYAATHRNGHRVAVKVLHPALADDETIRERFLREGYLANQVAHPGAMAVLDDDVLDSGTPYLVMELLRGAPLDQACDEAGGRLPLATACQLGLQLLDVLAAAHDQAIVHRDIKPQNLFWTEDGALKVLDFGIARLQGPGAPTLTRTGEVFGTPAFMAPEQAIGDMARVDAASDQWAAAATIVHLATGSFVHEASTANEMIVRCATQQARSFRALDPRVPPGVAAAVDRALRFRKDERWPHVRDFRQALARACAGELGLVAPTPVAGGRVAGPRRPAPRGAHVAVIGSVAAAMVVGALAFAAVRAARGTGVDAPPAAPDPVLTAGPAAPPAAPVEAPPAEPSVTPTSSRPAPAPRGSASAPSPRRGERRDGARGGPGRRPDPWSAQ